MKRLIPRVLVLGYSEAAMLLRNPGEVHVSAIIAIHGQREFAVSTDQVERSLILRFDDTEAPDLDDPLQASRIRWRQREAAEIGLEMSPPKREHARQIIEFAQSIQNVDGSVLCQCQGGVSRSAAAAILCLATWTGSGHEEECVEQLLAARACAIPHSDVVRFGDELLGRRALVEAVQRRIVF